MSTTIGWLTAVIDRPPASLDSASEFWLAATGASLSPSRGADGRFATLLPPTGDAFIRVQRLPVHRGCHVDFHTEDVDRLTHTAQRAGATLSRRTHQLATLRSPAGVVFCIVRHHGEHQRPAPQTLPDGTRYQVDQVCIDIPADRYAAERQFWPRLTSWDLQTSSSHEEFSFLVRPSWSPLRLLLQRRDDSDAAIGAHLDIANDDITGVVAHLRDLGARVRRSYDHWTTMEDPSGFPFCVTARDPDTGQLREHATPDRNRR